MSTKHGPLAMASWGDNKVVRGTVLISKIEARSPPLFCIDSSSHVSSVKHLKPPAPFPKDISLDTFVKEFHSCYEL